MPPLRASYSSGVRQSPPINGWSSLYSHTSPPRFGDYTNGRDRERERDRDLLYGNHDPRNPRPPPPLTGASAAYTSARSPMVIDGPGPSVSSSSSSSSIQQQQQQQQQPQSHHPHPHHTHSLPPHHQRHQLHPARSPDSHHSLDDADERSPPNHGSTKAASISGQGQQGPRTIQSKACVNCRRSKVKCVNDGSGGPCRRCLDIKLECKWRVRIDDEAWRESVESRFHQLSTRVDALAASSSSTVRKADTTPAPTSATSPSTTGDVYQHPAYGSLFSSSNKAGSMLPPPSVPSGSRPSLPTYSPSLSAFSMFKSSPSSDLGNGGSGPLSALSPRDRLPPPAMMVGSVDTSMSNGDYSQLGHDASSRGRSSSSARLEGIGSGPSQPFFPNPDYKVTSPMGEVLSSSQDSRETAESLQHFRMKWEGKAPGMPQRVNNFHDAGKLPGSAVQWESGSYTKAVSYVGREDPRLSLISLRLLPCPMVTNLIIYFGKNLQCHSFGFPSFPPNEMMTPLILSSLCFVASIFDPTGRQYTPAIRQYIAGETKHDDADLLAEHVGLNPELGVGVEEITGACIAASWASSRDSDRLAKVARFWALKYLRQFEAQMHPDGKPGEREKTISEKLTLLPPYRMIDRPQRLRIWLESYIVDAVASIMFHRDLFVPDLLAKPFCEELRGLLLSSAEDRAVGSGKKDGLEAEDIQLIGHAALLDIFIHATSICSRQDARAQAMLELQQLMWDDLEAWREGVSRDIDLSSNTPVAVDLGLMYYLTRVHLANLALNLALEDSRCSPSSPTSSLHTRAQHSLVNQGKDSAILALQIARESFGERLLRLPTWYHHLFAQTVSFLLRLMQDQKWFVTAQNHHILSHLEGFVQSAHYYLEIHAAQTPSPTELEAHSNLPGMGVALEGSSACSSTSSATAVEGGGGGGGGGGSTNETRNGGLGVKDDSPHSSHLLHHHHHQDVGRNGASVTTPTASTTAPAAVTGTGTAAATGTGTGGGTGGGVQHPMASPATKYSTVIKGAHPASGLIHDMYRGVIKMRGAMSN